VRGVGNKRRILIAGAGGALDGANIPGSVRVAIAEPQSFVPVADVRALTLQRLKGCAAAIPARTAEGGVLILCDDITRPTPTSEIIPVLSDFLQEIGVAKDRQLVLFATGTHKAMNDKEAKKKIGEAYGWIKWLSHSRDTELLRVGFTDGGIPVDVNPLVKEYAYVIGVGAVFPHRYCGWSGGGKIVLPGVSGARSVSATHWMPYHDASITLGSMDNLAMREIASAARISGLSFLIQVVCTGDGRVKDIVTGLPDAAHRQAIEIASQCMTVSVPESDIVVAEAWPEDADLWQAGKALYAAENIVREGGEIILAAALPEGLGPHRLYAELMNSDPSEILSHRSGGESASVAAAAAFITARVREKAKITIVTNSPHSIDITNTTGVRTYETFQEAMDGAVSCKAGTVAVLRQAPLMLPVRK